MIFPILLVLVSRVALPAQSVILYTAPDGTQMSEAHLEELRSALARRGWRVVAERLRGEDDVLGAATWEICRPGNDHVSLIDFAGFGGMGEDISLNQSHACNVRGRGDCHLYFRRINRSRERWLADLAHFVACLGSAGDA
jgi:hypothetical protein